MSKFKSSKKSDDIFLEHYGIKGMQWGFRKAPESSDSSASSVKSNTQASKGLTDRQKTALKIGAGALLVGAAIGGAILVKNGNIPINNLRLSRPNISSARSAINISRPNSKSSKPMSFDLEKLASRASSAKEKFDNVKTAAETAKRGKEVIDEMRANEIFRKKVQDFQKEIEQAQHEQTKYLIDDSAKSGLPYDATQNPYSLEAQRKRRR